MRTSSKKVFNARPFRRRKISKRTSNLEPKRVRRRIPNLLIGEIGQGRFVNFDATLKDRPDYFIIGSDSTENLVQRFLVLLQNYGAVRVSAVNHEIGMAADNSLFSAQIRDAPE
jgi:hypothetical protein